MSFPVRNSVSVILLPATAILYCCLQWLAASTMGGNKIFSSSMRSDSIDLAKMVNVLTTFGRKNCAPREQHTLLFDDADVLSSYIVDTDSRFEDCDVIRETPVTPFTSAETSSCHALLAREYVPTRRDSIESSLAIDTTRTSFQSEPLVLWISTDRRYGLAVYGRPCVTQPGAGL
jgi:hypothetical protein